MGVEMEDNTFAQAVGGPVPKEELGVTLTHEHLFMDGSSCFELADADDAEEAFQKIDDKTILVKSGYKIEDIEKYYEVKIKIDDEEIDTVGGLLFFLANKVPKNNQVYNYENIL